VLLGAGDEGFDLLCCENDVAVLVEFCHDVLLLENFSLSRESGPTGNRQQM
jgi:hypothetical protein